MSLNKMLAVLAAGFVLVVGLFIYVFVIEPGVPTTDEALLERGLVFQYKDAQKRTIRDVATRIEVHRGQEKVVLERPEAGALAWRLTQPVQARADRSAALAILDQLRDLRIESIVELADDSPESLAKYGLKEPRATASFSLEGKSHDFAVGSQAPGETASAKKTYLRVGAERRVLIVDDGIADRLCKAPNDFRDKRVFDQDPEKSASLQVKAGERTIELAKVAKAWELKAPVADAADASKVKNVLSKARTLEVEKFITEDASKLADYGLDKPQLTCQIKAEDGSPMTLLVGSKTKDDEKVLYAKRAEEPTVFTIKADFLKEAELKPEDVRQRQVAAFDNDDATRLEITHAKATWAVSRKNKDDSWQMSKPKSAKADASSVDDFLRNVGRLRADRWVDDPKDKAFELLKAPATSVALLREPDGKPDAKKDPIRIALSAPVKTDKEEGLYVRRSDQKFLLFVSSKKPADSAPSEEKDSAKAAEDLAKALPLGYLTFFDRSVFSFKTADVTRVTIERDKLKLVCDRVGENWKLTSPVLMDADKSNVNTILDAMHSLAAAEYVAESPKSLKAYGLDAPTLRLTVTLEEKKAEAKDEKKDEKAAKADAKAKEKGKEEKKTETKTILVSRKIDGKTYAMAEGGTLVFTLKEWDVNDLRTEPISTTIGDFALDDVASLVIAHKGKAEIVLEKDKDTWQVAKPKKAEADQDAAKKALEALRDLRAKRYVDYDAKDLKPYGLDPPEVLVTVKFKAEEKDKGKEEKGKGKEEKDKGKEEKGKGKEEKDKGKEEKDKGKGEKEKGKEEKEKEKEKEKAPKDFVLRIGKPAPDEKDEPCSYAQKGDAKQIFLMTKTKVEEIALSLEAIEKKPEPKKEEKGETKAPQPKAPEPKAPEPKAPEPKVPEPKAPAPKAPEAKAPEPKAPAPKAPEPKAPEAKAPPPKAPEAKAPEAKAPEAKAPAPPPPTPKAPEAKTPEPKAPDAKAVEPKKADAPAPPAK